MSNNPQRDNELRKNRRAERRSMAVKLLGGKCANCDSTEKLDFDHINNDRAGVKYLISQMFHNKLELLLDELEKCQLLCKSCHALKSARERGGGKSVHGKLSMYMNKGCRCSLCRSANASYYRIYKQKRKLA